MPFLQVGRKGVVGFKFSGPGIGEAGCRVIITI